MFPSLTVGLVDQQFLKKRFKDGKNYCESRMFIWQAVKS